MKPKDIAKIINDCFDPSPAEKAAMLLHEKGVTETNLWILRNEKEFRLIPDPWRVNIGNALRDIERKEREKDARA